MDISNKYFGFHKSLQCIELTDTHGFRLGFFIGLVIDYDCEKICSKLIELNSNKENFDIEEIIYKFGGSFIFRYEYPSKRIYLDANGSLSLVYDIDQQKAASTIGLLINSKQYNKRFNKLLYNYLEVEREVWFPAKMTAHEGIERFLCNHYLDIEQWKQIRFWPKGEIFYERDTEKQVTRNYLYRLLEGMKQKYCLLVQNNGVIISQLFQFQEKKQFLTLLWGEKISNFVNIPHQRINTIYSSEEEKNTWSFLSSHCVGGGNMLTHQTLRQILDTDIVFI